jgi:predicted nucleic acid-binding Zn ribbon protein
LSLSIRFSEQALARLSLISGDRRRKMSDQSDPAIQFRRRQRIAGIISLSLWIVIGVLRYRFPLAGFGIFLYMMASLGVAICFIWAWRCTVCGGGIKLDGKTCSKCGRVLR